MGGGLFYISEPVAKLRKREVDILTLGHRGGGARFAAGERRGGTCEHTGLEQTLFLGESDAERACEAVAGSGRIDERRVERESLDESLLTAVRREQAARSEGDHDVLYAAAEKYTGRFAYILVRIGGYSCQNLGLGFVWGYQVEHGIKPPGQLTGGRRVQNDTRPAEMGGGYNREDRVQIVFKLGKQDVGVRNSGESRTDILGGYVAVCAEVYQNRVLAGRLINKYQGCSCRIIFITEDMLAVYPLSPVKAKRDIGKNIPSELCNHINVAARAPRRDALVGAFAARPYREGGAEQGFTGAGEAGRAPCKIGVETAENDDFPAFHKDHTPKIYLWIYYTRGRCFLQSAVFRYIRLTAARNTA